MRIAEILKSEEKFRNPFGSKPNVEITENSDTITNEDDDVAAERKLVNKLEADNVEAMVSNGDDLLFIFFE